MTVAFLTADLVFPSRVAGITNRLGARLITAGTFDSLAAKLDANEDALVVIIDLSSPAIDPTDVVPKFRELSGPPSKIIAFGPHVHEAKLEAARQAGCDLVLTRGQFDAQMERLISASFG